MKKQISDEAYNFIWKQTLRLLGKIFLITVPIAAISILSGQILDQRFNSSPAAVILCGISGLGLIFYLVSRAAKQTSAKFQASANQSENKEEER